MTKMLTALGFAAMIAVPTFAHADDPANKNGSSQAKPDSSAAATPGDHKHSAGTVGAMKGAEGGSFTAKDDGKDAKTEVVSASATPCPAAALVVGRHLHWMAKENVVVRSSEDWDIPEPWEVVSVASDGAEVVVERTPTQDEAHTKAAEQKTS